MKILCLHGMLTSGAIFEFQTAAFRNLLGNDYEYVFIDGEVEVEDPSCEFQSLGLGMEADPLVY